MSSREAFYREQYTRDMRSLFGVDSSGSGSGASRSGSTYFEADPVTEDAASPATGERMLFTKGPGVPGNLTLTSPGGETEYVEGVHYIETTGEDGRFGFENLSIPAGTPLSATYFVDPGASPASPPVADEVEDPEPLTPLSGWSGRAEVYTDRQRVYLSGLLTGGETDEDTPLFAALPTTRASRLMAMSAGGPVTVHVAPSGEARLGPSPFVCGEWLALDGLSYRTGSPAFAGWGDASLVFGSEELDVTYGDLS